ncbi:MAG: hypothetical protein JXA71_10815 [Chitinispirillaceae bacterium]|nr:hypothetical protein [Chitinispirillaceae bacterium]
MCARYAAVTAVIVLFTSGFSQTLDISGRVVDQTGQPLENVGVLLVGQERITATDAQGRYAFGSSPVNGSKALQTRPSPRLTRGTLRFSVIGRNLPVTITLFDLKGRIIREFRLGPLPAGAYSYDLYQGTSRLPSGMVVLQVRIGTDAFILKSAGSDRGLTGTATPAGFDRLSAPLAASAAPVDSLFFWITGYENAKHPLTSLSAASLIDTLRPGIAFEPHFFGNGDIIDMRDSQTVHLPIPQRMQVVVFGEGYALADLAAGRYETDLGRWMTDVFRLRIAAYFKESYIVWKFRSPSNQHLTGEGQVDSYFKLPLSGRAMASGPYDSAAAIMWRALQRFPFMPRDYAYGSAARNLVCSFMLYDSTRSRSGFSGQMRTFSNPSTTSQRVYVAMALGQQHEFMHAMARLSDEYYDAGHSPLGASSATQTSQRITNVVFSAKCDSLPWKHLLKGDAINPDTDSLIGAFGANGRFHPTLKCLMNGTHDNADLFGGNGLLRTDDRHCNWCEELLAFRTYERVLVLPDQATAWECWVTDYRGPFYRCFGFYVPAVVPQTNNTGVAYFMPCIQ